jgi:hypothetical protein
MVSNMKSLHDFDDEISKRADDKVNEFVHYER